MKKLWFLTYSDEAALKYNKEDYTWQNPLWVIEDGMTHIFSGYIDDKNEIEEDDTVYIYGGGDKRSADNKNGLYAEGTVKKIIPDENKGKKHKFAVITIKKRGIPIINSSEHNDIFKPYYLKASRNYGCCELTKENDKAFLDFLDEKLSEIKEETNM